MAQCTDLVTVARYLRFAPQRLYYLIHNKNHLYYEFEIRKLNDPSKTRKIVSPIKELKGVQRVILKEILEQVPISDQAFAYIKGRSVVAAAKNLLGQQNVLRLDIADFFPTISDRRVYGLFASLGFCPKTSWIFAQLSTHNGRLAQGAPTSPYISNLICRGLDRHLNALATSWDLRYLRYSDDIYFHGYPTFNSNKLTAYVEKILRDHGFRMNKSKIRYHGKGIPRNTLGVLTHGRVIQLPRRARKNYRAAFFKASKNPKWGLENISILSGMAEYYKAIYGSNSTYLEYKNIIKTVRALRLHDPYFIQ